MTLPFHRAVVGAFSAGLLCLPLVAMAAKPAPRKPAPKKPPAAPKADPRAGKTAFQAEGCTSCHKTKDYPQGGNLGPDLSTVGKEKKVEEIVKYIKKPMAGSQMPPYKGPATTLANLGAYLAAQK